ncbi:AMP-binding protein [Streptomyces solisilvae]|uniref:AMP-binding protein n=1 Tax=Streptomyces malaysiensis TaxID=92644 RepID=UPI003692F442
MYERQSVFADIQDPLWPPTAVRPSAEAIEGYRREGQWRAEHFLTDLHRHRRERPGEIAVIGYRADGTTETLSWSRYADQVEQFASALRALGVGPGQVVAVQLPNWWETSALILAVMRTGAVVAPVTAALRGRELEKLLAQLRVTVMVTVGEWYGYDYAGALAEMAERLPHLRHRVVAGRDAGPGEMDFQDHFQRTPWAQQYPMPLDEPVDPDQVALVLFTAGTTGEPKGVLHTSNTMSAAAGAIVGEERISGSEASYTPHSLTSILSITVSLVSPVLSGSRAVLFDKWAPGRIAEIVAEARVSIITAAASFIDMIVRSAVAAGNDTSSLRYLFSEGAPIPPKLVREVYEELGVALRATYGMTELSVGTWTRPSDPPDWAAHSDGRPGPAAEIDLRADGEVSKANPAVLYVRGAGVCVAYVGLDTGAVEILCDRDDGWLDTGDLVVPDGRGGIRHVGRVADRIGDGFMIPVVDVEAQVLEHPAVAAVAIVGYFDAVGKETGCAVIVAAGPPPTLEQLRTYLTAQGMAEAYQPTRLEVVPVLPRNANGKVLKRELRQRVQEQSGHPA